jgi:HD superfamily phosphohydrolase
MFIYDIIHGYMEFNKEEKKFIDNCWMKRLKRIKQLGLLEHVFPSASHNRFEHSLGVSYLSGKYLEILSNKSDNFNPNKSEILCVKLAGLLHDIGHGPFSHIFDILLSKQSSHERRSQNIVEYMFKEIGTSKNFKSAYMIDTIKEMIEPSKLTTDPLYNIVNNRITKIDVDKFDYLMRDPQHMGISGSFDYERIFIKSYISRNEIIYDYSIYNNILELYMTRYRYHKEIYNHKTVKIIELMLKDALLEADKVYNFKDWSSDERFLSLDDSIYSKILNSDDKDLTKAKNILKRIEKRDLYKLLWIGQKENIPDEVEKKETKRIDMKFNLCNGNKFPLQKVKFYNNDIIQTGDKFNLNTLYPNCYEDNTVMIYSV